MTAENAEFVNIQLQYIQYNTSIQLNTIVFFQVRFSENMISNTLHTVALSKDFFRRLQGNDQTIK